MTDKGFEWLNYYERSSITINNGGLNAIFEDACPDLKGSPC
jgi:hypothetical protein